jgi:hypothetical protein
MRTPNRGIAPVPFLDYLQELSGISGPGLATGSFTGFPG